jgi:hypothetical protein
MITMINLDALLSCLDFPAQQRVDFGHMRKRPCSAYNRAARPSGYRLRKDRIEVPPEPHPLAAGSFRGGKILPFWNILD